MKGSFPKLTLKEKLVMREYREAGMELYEIAESWNLSIATVCRYLKELRARMGPEKLKNPRRARSHLYGQTAPSNGVSSQ